VKLEHFFRPQAGYREHFENTCGNLLAHSLQARVAAGLVKLGDDIGNGFANSWDLLQAALRHEVFQRFGDCQEVFSRPGVSLGRVWVATPQRRPLTEFAQKTGNRWSVKF